MKYLAILSYWIVAVLLLASVMGSFGYDLRQSLFLATALLPGLFCAKLLLPDAMRTLRRRVVAVACVAAGGLIVEWLALLLAYRYTLNGSWLQLEKFPGLFSNPAFLVLLSAAIVIPEALLDRWLDRRLPRMKNVTFISERRKVTLPVGDILFVESNDNEVLLHTAAGVYRTKTRISQWEQLLDDRFVRIHRAFLVNAGQVTGATPTRMTVGGRTLDVSRKYRDATMARFGGGTSRSTPSGASL